jgi:homogentisate 1,2-dioxygenase
VIAEENNITARLLKGFDVEPKDDFLEARVPVLTNSDVTLHLAAPRKSMTDYFYKNSEADELLFIHKGEGTLRTMFGNIEFEYGDYLLIPRGVIWQIDFKVMITASLSPNRTSRSTRRNGTETGSGSCGRVHPFVSGITNCHRIWRRMTRRANSG